MCGIFGIIQNKKKKFDKRAFIMLGIGNDRRGKDSCGIFIDDWAEYGVGKEKLFLDFFKESVLLDTITDAKVILGHCRKASVGAVNEANAQPVVIYNEKDDPDFVLIHNGTIYNYKKLAEKYIPNIDITNMTDSQVMARIFYYAGYSVLQEYEGGGMFVMYDLRTNKVYMFKGSSLANSTAKEASEERPCYFVQANDNIIFSSVYEELEGLYFNDTVYILPANKLLQVKNGKLYNVAEYDRSNCKQYRPVITYYNKYYTDTYDDTYYNTPYISNYINFNQNNYRYYNGGKIVDGELFVSNYGCISDTQSKYNSPYYFVNGILVYDKRCYEYLMHIKKTQPNNTIKFNIALNCLQMSPLVMNDKLYKVDYETFKVVPCASTCIYFGSKILVQDEDKIKVQYNNGVNHIPTLNDDTFSKIINYVESI